MEGCTQKEPVQESNSGLKTPSPDCARLNQRMVLLTRADHLKHQSSRPHRPSPPLCQKGVVMSSVPDTRTSSAQYRPVIASFRVVLSEQRRDQESLLTLNQDDFKDMICPSVLFFSMLLYN